MASKVTPARGMRDILPSEKSRREAALTVIRSIYRSYGYEEIETPALEELDRLESGQGGENEKMLFRVIKRGIDMQKAVVLSDALDLGLRFDLTVPLARFYASQENSLPDVARLIQIGPVWRAERPQRGRYRQFTQCDIDIVGEESSLAEVELVCATTEALDALGVGDFWLRLNDRDVLTGILQSCGVADSAVARSLIAVDKLDKVGSEGVVAELVSTAEVEPKTAIRVVDLLGELADYADPNQFDELASRLPALVPEDAVNRLKAVASGIARAAPQLKTKLDMSLVRGMGYYTGPIFEMSSPLVAGSIAGGGRYDRMIGRFLGRDLPACGFSIGFERIVDHVTLSAEPSMKCALVYSPDVPVGELVYQQNVLRREGYAVLLVLEKKRMGAVYDRLFGAGYEFVAMASAGDDGDPVFSEVRRLERR